MMSSFLKRNSLVLAATLGVLLSLLATVGLAFLMQKPYQFQGSLIEPAHPAPDFMLGTQSGGSFRLAEQQGLVVLIFFGYTHCPDVCPATLAEYRQIYDRLGDQAGRVRFVFITVDPERDTADHLAEYLGFFNPDFIGLTGSEADLEPVYQGYYVYRQKQEVGSTAGYLMDHTARIYVVDKAGNLRLTYPFGFETARMILDIRYLIEE